MIPIVKFWRPDPTQEQGDEDDDADDSDMLEGNRKNWPFYNRISSNVQVVQKEIQITLITHRTVHGYRVSTLSTLRDHTYCTETK